MPPFLSSAPGRAFFATWRGANEFCVVGKRPAPVMCLLMSGLPGAHDAHIDQHPRISANPCRRACFGVASMCAVELSYLRGRAPPTRKMKLQNETL